MPNSLPDLTRSEYEILNVLWREDALNIREVSERLDNGWAYSTTKTTMDRMAKKGLLVREDFHGVFLYKPSISRPRGMVKMLRYLAERVLLADADTVVSMFATNHELSSSEIKELRKLLKEEGEL